MQLRELGVGCFGKVYALRLEGGSGSVAIKTCGAERGRAEFDCLWAIGQAEVPHTIKAVSALVDAGPPLLPSRCAMAIAMTRVPGVTLREYLGAVAITGMRVSQQTLHSWTAQLFDFLLHLQVRLGLSHDDLKMGNIMVESMRLTVVDYTFAAGRKPSEWRSGTVCYMAPERLFSETQPPCATPEGPDIWAIGTLMATCALTGEPLAPNILNADEGFFAVDEQGRFNARHTDTVYHLLSRGVPWFNAAVCSLSQQSKIDEEYVEQGIRLLLWTRAYLELGDNPEFALPAMPGMQNDKLYVLIARNTPALLDAYDTTRSRLFEKVAALLRQCLGPRLYRVWCKTQTWNPQRRGKLEAYQNELALYPPVQGGRFISEQRPGPVRTVLEAFLRDVKAAPQ